MIMPRVSFCAYIWCGETPLWSRISTAPQLNLYMYCRVFTRDMSNDCVHVVKVCWYVRTFHEVTFAWPLN